MKRAEIAAGATASSAADAASRARPSSSVTTAFNRGLNRSILARYSSSSSLLPISFARIASANSPADWDQTSLSSTSQTPGQAIALVSRYCSKPSVPH